MQSLPSTRPERPRWERVSGGRHENFCFDVRWAGMGMGQGIGWPKSMGLWGYEVWPPQKSHWKIKHLAIGSGSFWQSSWHVRKSHVYSWESHTSLIMSRSWTSMVRPQNFCARYQLTSFGRCDVWVILFWEPVCFENRLYSRSTGLYVGWCLISVPWKTRRPSGTLCDCSWSHICFWCRSHHYHTIAFQYHSWLSLSRLSRSWHPLVSPHLISACCEVHYYHCFEDEWNRMTLAEVGASLVKKGLQFQMCPGGYIWATVLDPSRTLQSQWLNHDFPYISESGVRILLSHPIPLHQIPARNPWFSTSPPAPSRGRRPRGGVAKVGGWS